MGRTRKPCPGCGEVISYREADKVCTGCANLIKEARTMRAEVMKLRDVKVITIPKTSYMCPSYRVAGNSYTHPETDPKEVEEELRDAVVALARVQGTPATCGRDSRSYKPYLMYRWDHYRSDDWNTGNGNPNTEYLVENENVEAMTRLDLAIQHALEQAFWCGRKDGQNIMRGLASGDFSVEEFNDRAAGRRKHGDYKQAFDHGDDDD